MLRLLALVLVVLVAPAVAAGQGYVLAEGGGGVTGSPVGREMLGWLVEKGGKGPALVIGARAGSEPDLEAEATLRSLGVEDVRNILITEDAADAPETYEAIVRCRVVWIRGGDQSRYVRYWKGTRTEEGLREVFRRGGAIGGTSAGCAVLGEVIYDAFNGSCSARDALRDGRTGRITLTDDMLGLTPGVLFDTHFTERGRLARLAVMLGRAWTGGYGGADLIGVGMDTWTALAVEPDGVATVLGTGAATILMRGEGTTVVLADGRPPVVTDLSMAQLTRGQRFDLRSRRVVGGPRPVEGGEARVEVGGPERLIRGRTLGACRVGAVYPDDTDDRRALFEGRLRVVEGEGVLPWAAVATRVFEAQPENRLGGLLHALALRPGLVGIALDSPTDARWADGVLSVETRAGDVPSSMLVIDGRGVSAAGVGEGPRQTGAFVGARLHVLAPGWSWSPRDGVVAPGAGGARR